jgi:dolichol-phosphate mannosyltransferase
LPEGISLLVPAWNEERRVAPALDRYLKVLEKLGSPYEVLVVCDGVTDRTAEIARGYSHRGVTVHEFPTRLGKGGAVVAGMAMAKYDTIGYLDADSPVTDADIRRLIGAIGPVDAAIGSRRLRGSVFTKNVPFGRRVFRVGFNVMSRSVLGLRCHDTQCGAKFFRREALLPVLPRIRLRGWAFDAAILFELNRDGRTIEEIAVTWNYDNDSRLPLAQQVPLMLLSIASIRFLSLLGFAQRVAPRSTWWFMTTFLERTPEKARLIEGAISNSVTDPFGKF